MSLHELPANLPVPMDDGAAAHLVGMRLPEVALPSTAGRLVPLRAAGAGRAVFFFYPRTGTPGQPPASEWNAIPGARG
ncbi:MAG TPA: hypothetical protein VFN71_10705 [Methylomirabilota bacterium]|nr:hypothetical protein [Methylomirabilota bacterium]